MNTQKLQNKFPKVYQDFFSECQKVVSAPHSFLWTGDFSGFYDGLTIASKIPLRFYVGYQRIEENKLEIEKEFLAYDFSEEKFLKIQLDSDLFEKISKLLKNKLSGVRVRFFSEVPLGISLGGLGAISASLAKLSYPDRDFDQLFKIAWEFAKKLQTGRTLGTTTFAAMKETKYPVVFNSTKNKYIAKSFDEIFDKLKSASLPVDFGLIYSGTLVHRNTIITSFNELKRISNEREIRIGNFQKNRTRDFWSSYLEFLDQIAHQNMFAFSRLFTEGATNENLNFLFNTINQYQNLLYYLGVSNSIIDEIYAGIHSIANSAKNGVGSGSKISGVGRGGSVLFAMPYGQHRKEIAKLPVTINNSKPKMIYSSFEDGIEEGGTKVEQDLENHEISSHISEDSKLLILYEKDRKVSKILLQNTDKIDADLVVDIDNKKLFITGKKIDSKMIPSQKATAEIIEKLLEKGEIKNVDLPKSYAKNRFDLQSKITAPLEKLLNVRFEISGGMYDNYKLKIKNNKLNIKIGIIKSI